MSPSSHEWLLIPPALFICFFPHLPEKSWPESSWFGKGKSWAHFTGKDSSVNSLQFIVSAVTATFPLAGLCCGILVGMNGKWIAVAVRHERGCVCACGHCKLLLCVQDTGFAWINISCSLFPSKDYLTLGARWEGLGVYTIKLTRALHKCSFVSLRQAPSFTHNSYSSGGFVMLKTWLVMTIYSKSRELLCFGKSSGVSEGPCLVCVEGIFLALDFTSVSISSQQQCLQKAFGLILLGSDIFFLCFVDFDFFFH